MKKTEKGCHVLFVCTGNTCRSVLAEAFFRQQWKGEGLPGTTVQSSSAGLAATGGVTASSGALALLRSEGLHMEDHRARPVEADMLETAHYIFTMTAAQKQYILDNYPRCRNKVWTLGEFGGGEFDIADPYGGGREAYLMAAVQIKRALAAAVTRLSIEIDHGRVRTTPQGGNNN